MTERPTLTAPARLELTARAVKLTLIVDPAVLDGFVVPDGQRVRFRGRAEGRQLDGDLNPKTVRKAMATIAEHGAANVALVIQGKLGDGTVEEAGIVAQVKGPRA